MSTELTMPQMGYDMQEGTVVRWLKAEGAEVAVGEPIAEIETDKAVVEFESYAAGLLGRILVPEGTTVPVGEPIAIVAEEGEELPEVVIQEPEPATEVEAEAVVEEIAPPVEERVPLVTPPPPGSTVPLEDVPVAEARAVRASPVARRLAEERGIDLTEVTGTGPGGRITKDDVLAIEEPSVPEEELPAPADVEPTDEMEPAAEIELAADVAADEPVEVVPVAEVEAPEPAVVAPPDLVGPEPAEVRPAAEVAAAGEAIPLSRMRQQIARVTVRSKQEKPHFYVSTEIEMTRAMELRQQINRDLEGEGVRVTVNDLIIKACVEALKRYPKFNAYLEGDAIKMNDQINIGVAIAEEEGLIVPAIMDCANKPMRDIASASKDLASRATSGSLRPQEYTGGTFAISNLGMFDVSSFIAIIHPPQTAVLAVGTVGKRPVVQDDQIVIAEMMTATLSADHRVVDGAEGARFLVEVKSQLQNPLTLVV